MESGLEVPAWFPVIDTSRCTICGKCARFCLFGVYRFDRKSLEVVAPLNCKNNCPACGRTCPASAIIFPRLPENSVLAGAEPEEPGNVASKESLSVLLNDRNRSRTNIFREGLIQLAEMDRQKALDEIQKLTTKK
jgi:NAD-dependent dihydropyrimidine dehydrogenase PreA subunit